MNTIVPLPPPTVPIRGMVSRTWIETLVLAGFMDDQHLQRVLGEYLATADATEQASINSAIQTARNACAALPPVDFSDTVRGILTGQEIDAFTKDPVFTATFQTRPYRFATVRADKLIAVQTTVNPRHDSVPTAPKELFDFCLPHRWDVPAEISFIPPNGPIHIVSSAPTLNGVRIDLDGAGGKVILSAAPHINLVLINEFNGRFYLRNGYHRVFDLLSNGQTEIPALVSTAIQPSEIELNPMAFNPVHLMTLARPPLVADFLGPATIHAKVRERRYGVTVNLDIKPINIGI